MAGILSVVGTPIGNLSDTSPRVVETLSSSDLILCEDTRVTAKLLSHFNVRTPLKRADENTLAARVPSILEGIASGDHVAFVSDAGMPGISDPGQRLVDAALDADLIVEVIPGPSAVVCALVASGLPMQHFFFEGFLPRKSGAQRKRLEELSSIFGALVIYESPHRVAATLKVIAEVFANRRVALVRELTKMHEEVLRDRAPLLAEIVARRDSAPGGIRGECVIVVAPPEESQENQSVFNDIDALDAAIQRGLVDNESKSFLAKRLAKQFDLQKSEVYNRILMIAGEDKQ